MRDLILLLSVIAYMTACRFFVGEAEKFFHKVFKNTGYYENKPEEENDKNENKLLNKTKK